MREGMNRQHGQLQISTIMNDHNSLKGRLGNRILKFQIT